MSSKLKIGLIVDGEHVSNHIYELAEWASTTDCLNVSHLIIQQHPPTRSGRETVLSSLMRDGPWRAATVALWKAKNKLESNGVARSGIVSRRGRTFNVGELVPGKIRVTPLVSKSGFVHRFSDQDLDKIRQEAFDVLIRCGTGILKGAILNSARLGIVSFHHGDNRINRGGPPGFWEVYHRQPRTGFVVQRLTEELDGGAVIMRGYIPTQENHLLNAAVLFIKSYHHLRTLLLRIGRTRQLPPAEAQTPYSGKLLVAPGFRELTVYLLRQAARTTVTHLRRALGRKERWGICFAKTDWRGAILWRGTRIETPAGRFLADPFVAARNGRTCVFAEDFVFRTARAHISAFELTEDGAHEVGVAVKEDFHLSFPYLFEFNGSLFMCPESYEAREIRIYECTEFPLKWKLATIAMRNVTAADSMIFQKDGLWWLLTNINRTEPRAYCAELHLFWARTPLTSHWEPHAGNPILVDPQTARNGGLLHDKGELIRVAQCHDFGSYGASASLFRITRINPSDYAEELLTTVTPGFLPGIHGTHHFHSNGEYSVWDFKKWERP